MCCVIGWPLRSGNQPWPENRRLVRSGPNFKAPSAICPKLGVHPRALLQRLICGQDARVTVGHLQNVKDQMLATCVTGGDERWTSRLVGIEGMQEPITPCREHGAIDLQSLGKGQHGGMRPE